MKTRIGLVSNSSTSSFVMFGYKVRESQIDKRKIYETLTSNDAEEAMKEAYDLSDPVDDLEGYMSDFLGDLFYGGLAINEKSVSIKGSEGEFGKGILMIGYEPVSISEYETEIFPLELDSEFFSRLADALELPEDKREVMCAAGTEYC